MDRVCTAMQRQGFTAMQSKYTKIQAGQTGLGGITHERSTNTTTVVSFENIIYENNLTDSVSRKMVAALNISLHLEKENAMQMDDFSCAPHEESSSNAGLQIT